MKNYSQGYFITDIHGYNQALNQAYLLATSESPLFILGDLFDAIYGNEQQIIDLLLEMEKSNRCQVIIGNHDEVLYLMFFRFKSDQTIELELSNPGFQRVSKVLKTLCSELFYYRYEMIRQELNDSNLELQRRIDRYYSEVNQLIKEFGFESIIKKLEQLFSISKYSQIIQIGRHQISLTHCGDQKCPFDLSILTPNYKLPQNCDLGIMGHITGPYIEDALKRVNSTITIDNFVTNQQISGLKISGNYIYNNHSKTIMIDDGSFTNLVKIESTN